MTDIEFTPRQRMLLERLGVIGKEAEAAYAPSHDETDEQFQARCAKMASLKKESYDILAELSDTPQCGVFASIFLPMLEGAPKLPGEQ